MKSPLLCNSSYALLKLKRQTQVIFLLAIGWFSSAPLFAQVQYDHTLSAIDSVIVKSDGNEALAELNKLQETIQSSPDSIRLQAHLYEAYGTVYANLSEFGLSDSAQVKSINYFLQYKDTAELVDNYSLLAAFKYRLGQIEEAKNFIEVGLRHANESTPNLSKIYTRAAAIYHVMGDKEKGKAYMQRGLEVAREQKDDTATAAALTNIGTIAHEEGNYPKALENYQAALKLSREQGYFSTMLPLLLNMGQIYEDQGDDEAALLHYQEAKSIAETKDLKRYTLGATLGIISIQLDKGKYDGLAAEVEEQLQIAKAVNDPSILIRTLNQKAELMLRLDSTAVALTTAQEAVTVSERLDQYNLRSASYIHLGLALLRLNQFAPANDACSKALAITESKDFTYSRMDAYECLYLNAAAKKEYETAYNYLKKYKVLSDSLLNSESIRKINSLILKNEYDEKILIEQLENEEYRQRKEFQLKAQRRVQLFTLGLLLLALIGLGAIYIALSNKRKYSNQLEKLNLLLQQNQERLVTSNKRLDQFAHSVSHDIVNRLSNIALDARLTKEDAKMPLQTFKSRTSETVNALINFCQNLLLWSETSSEVKEAVDANKIANRILKEYQLPLETHQFTVEKSDLPKVFLPEVVLEQVFVNLIDNAIKYSKHRTTPIIRIQAQIVNDELAEISIHDNGKGIASEHLEDIFSNQTDGRGLSFIKQSLATYQMQLRAEQNELGGASIYFTVPTKSFIIEPISK
ncbi:MAG: tetratricopeptide repeat protein [Bacteroidota bacterium]